MYRKLINKLRECSRDKDTYKNTLFREAADVIEELQMEKTDLIAELKSLQNSGYEKHGEWEVDGIGDENVYVCSICGKEWMLDDGTPQENEMSFCPRCGSDMRGE